MKEVNDQGLVLLWDKGKPIGYHATDYILNSDGSKVVVLASRKQQLVKAVVAANAEGINLIIDAGIRTFSKQVGLRISNRIAFENQHGIAPEDSAVKNITVAKVIAYRFEDTYTAEDLPGIELVLNAEEGQFFPRTARPGESNHHDGTAYDFRTKNVKTGETDLPLYTWQVRNLPKFGLFRTVPSERWHREFRDDWTIEDQFKLVPKDHPTWDGLLTG